MNQFDIVNELLIWIESNLTESLSIDHVANKSGYTKWHLQRMFKAVTGKNLGSYIRGRQLSKSAIALRLTTLSIIDISYLYQFESQQSFTRAFKQQFGETPARYRKANDWDVTGLLPPISLDTEHSPVANYLYQEEMTLYALTGKYRSTLDSFSQSCTLIREALWKEIIDSNKGLPSTIYGVHNVMPSATASDEQMLFYGIGITAENTNAKLYLFEEIIIEAGLYVKFSYRGPSADFQKFILKLYHTCLPSLGLIKRNGMDIEKYYTDKNIKANELSMNITCDYIIPVRRHERSGY